MVLPMADTTTAGLSMPRTLLARSLSRWVGGMDDPHKSIKTANPAAGAADPFLTIATLLVGVSAPDGDGVGATSAVHGTLVSVDVPGFVCG